MPKSQPIKLTASDIVRFLAKVETRETKECWPWRGATDKDGYGRFNVNGQNKKANLVAYTIANGPIDLNACHSCDNPICCNPAHIWMGTDADNANDAKLKGRTTGDFRGKVINTKIAKLVAKLKEKNWSARQIATKLGLNLRTIRGIYYGQRWQHITRINT